MILNMVSVFDVIDYPVVSIEDPFDQDDWENTKILTSCGVFQVGFLSLVLIYFFTVNQLLSFTC